MDKIAFFSLVPHLTGFEGHQYSYHKAVEEALGLLKIEFTALVPNHCQINEWQEFFRKSKFRFFDFCKLFKNKNEKRRIFFLESFNTSDLLSLYLASFFCKKKDQIWLMLRYGPHQMRKSHLFLLKLFRKSKLLTDSELIALSFGQCLKRKIQVMPIPHTEVILEKKSGDKICCLWPGEPREAKGLKEIQKIALTLDSSFQLLASKHPLLDMAKIEFIERGVSREKYLQTLSKADILLLPYDAHVYKESTSGILVEAIIAGKMPLVKEGSWLAFELKKYQLSELIVDWETPYFFKEVQKLYHSEIVWQKLKEMQKSYRQFHCLSNFCKSLTSCITAL